VHNRRFHEELISAAASPRTYLILRIQSQHGGRYRRLCIGLEDAHRGCVRNNCAFSKPPFNADARAALALEDHISTTLMIVRRAPRACVHLRERVGALPAIEAPFHEPREAGGGSCGESRSTSGCARGEVSSSKIASAALVSHRRTGLPLLIAPLIGPPLDRCSIPSAQSRPNRRTNQVFIRCVSTA
jgi:hypothetical protein